MEENWKDIQGYEGLYQISDMGNVRSFSNFHLGDYLRLDIAKSNYLHAHLYKNNKRKHMLVHRLVAMAFIDNPENKQFVNHINGIKTDNRATNIEWVTRSENMRHAYDILGVTTHTKGKFGKDANGAKTIIQLTLSNEIVKVWGSLSEAARELGISISAISCCCSNRLKSTKGLKFQYANQ